MLLTMVSAPSSSTATAVTVTGPSCVGIKVQLACVRPSAQSNPGQEIMTCCPEGEVVSMSLTSTAETVMGDSTYTDGGWVRFMFGARLRISISTVKSSMSNSSSMTRRFTVQKPLLDQFHCVQHPGASMISTKPVRDSISNRHSTSPLSSSKLPVASRVTFSKV